MARVAIGTTDVVAPVFATTEVVVLFPARVATKTRLRSLFRRFLLERDDLRRIAFFDVGFAWPMTRLATSHLVFPTGDLRELRV